MKETFARVFAILLLLGGSFSISFTWWFGRLDTIILHARMPEAGGWTPGDLTVAVNQPLRLRLTSDDVMHGFAIGQSGQPAVDVKPGEIADITLTFDKPGTYTFYCTRWCGPNHWRMRGTIEVLGAPRPAPPAAPPLYLTLGLDIDAPHPAGVLPVGRPSANRGATLDVSLPAAYLAQVYYRSHSPAEAWLALRGENSARHLSDAEVWDLVAFVWQANSTPQALAEGQALYAANCAACHRESGRGDGVMAQPFEAGHAQVSPANFTDTAQMLGASPALLQGKIVRGGMGTGMPYWGPIFTEAQTWALVDYLWTFSMEVAR